MKKLIGIFVIVANLFRQSVSQNTGGCYLEGVSNSQWNAYYTNEAVYDTERTLFKSFAYENVTAVTVASSSSVYATASLNDSYVLITPSSSFEQYEQNEPSSSASPVLTIILSFTCISGTSQLTFRQPITDINNHDPTFSSSTYTYSLPMPFPSGITISGIFGDSITATDIDITNVAVDFAIDPEGDFSIEYGAVADSTNKVHTAILKAATSVRLTKTTSYTLTVTDRGTLPGTRSTNSTLTIHVDEENSVAVSPVFSSSYYTAVYTKITDGNDYITLNTDIVLSDSNYEDTTFEAQGDYSSYFTCTPESAKVRLVLSGNIPSDILISNSYIIVPIQASRTSAEYYGTTVVVVDLTNITDTVVSSPVFGSSYYTVTYNVNEEENDSISVETPISLTDQDYQNTNFSLAGEYSSYFDLYYTNYQIGLTLSGDLPEDVLYSTQFAILTLTATRNGAEVDGNTVIVVTLPGEQCTQTTTELTTASPTMTTEEVTVTQSPTETPATCPPCDCTTVTTSTSATDFPTSTTPFTTTEQPITCPPCTTVSDLTSTTTAPTNPTDTTTQSPITTECPTVTTECPPCITTSATTESTNTVPTSVTDTTTQNSITTECPTVATECPTVTTECPPTTCDCTTISDLPSGTTEYTTTETTIVSETTSQNPITTECPPTTCNCTTIPTFTPTTSVIYTTNTFTPAPTTQPSTPYINFDKSYYTFGLQPLHAIDVIGSVSATSSMAESIIYSIAASDGSIVPSQLSINEQTGELVTSDYITSGSYYLIATATGYSSGSTGHAFVFVYVGSVQVCTDDVRTAYSVVAKHITEEQLNYDIITLDAENYTYVIVEQFPVTNPFVFEINSTTGSLQTVGSIDREWEGISDMYVSQFTVRVRLIGANETFEPTLLANTTSFYTYEYPSYREFYQEEGRAWVNIEEKLYNVAKDTVVSVIVDDINDNSPVFTAGSSTVVGYPENDIVADVSPASLVTVEATDADIGLNALIRYSTDSDSIVVHESTGVVYPGASIFDDGKDEKEYTVTATDRNGSSDGLSSTIKIQVKKLEDEHLTILTVSGVTLEDVDTVLETISASCGYSVKGLTASVIPSSAKSTRVRAASDYALKLTTYAFDSNNNLVETESLQKAIASANISDTYGAVSWAAFSRSATSSSATTTGYFVSVIVLGVLLALFVVAAALYYFRHYRRRASLESYEKMMEENTPPPFKKNDRISHSESRKSDIANRRPTEYAFNPPPVDTEGDQPEGTIHPVTIKSDLATRRPTEYAFHPPPVEDVGDDPESNDDYSFYTVSNGSVPNGNPPEFSFTNATLKLDHRDSNETSTDDVSDDETNPSKRERRKSVTFNVNVEKIEIVKDDDDDDVDDDDDNDEDDHEENDHEEDEHQYDEIEGKDRGNDNDTKVEIARL